MEKLLTYLNKLSKGDRAYFFERCGTTEGYVRKAISTKQRIGPDLCINIERESGGEVKCEDMRPDVDWAFIRSSPPVPRIPTNDESDDDLPPTRDNLMGLGTNRPPD